MISITLENTNNRGDFVTLIQGVDKLWMTHKFNGKEIERVYEGNKLKETLNTLEEIGFEVVGN